MLPSERRISIARSARFYVLGDPSGAAELWLVCHGYGQLAARFIRVFQSIASPTRAVIAPEGLHRFYLDPPDRPATERRVGATWMTREHREADIADYVAYLDEVLRACGRTADQRVIALGFSQGTATIARWAALTANPPSRLVLWGSGFPSDFDWTAHTARIAAIPVQLVVGDQDEFATGPQLEAQEQILHRAGIRPEVVRYAGGHRVDADTLARLVS